MNLIIIILCILFFIGFHIKDKSLYHPVKLYMIVWGVLFFVYNLGWYPLPKIKQDTYQIVLAGIVSFTAGALLTTVLYRKPQKILKVERPSIIKIMLIFFFITMCVPFLNGLQLLFNGVDLHDIRYVYHDDIVGTGIGSVVFVYFSEPFLVFYLMYAIVNIFHAKKPFKSIIFAFIGVFMMTIARGGRFYLLYLIFGILIAAMLYRKSTISKRVNRYVKLIAVVAFSSIVGISIMRGADVGRTFYVYLSGSIPFLDHLIEDNSGLPYTLGLYSFNGYIRPIFVVLRFLGVMDLPIFMQVVEEVALQADEAYSIMPGELYNSFTTLFYSMYIDGGLLGVVIGNFILSIVSMISYKKLDNNNMSSVVFFLLMAVMLLLSFFRLLIISYTYALAFLYVILCFKTRKKEIIEYGR